MAGVGQQQQRRGSSSSGSSLSSSSTKTTGQISPHRPTAILRQSSLVIPEAFDASNSSPRRCLPSPKMIPPSTLSRHLPSPKSPSRYDDGISLPDLSPPGERKARKEALRNLGLKRRSSFGISSSSSCSHENDPPPAVPLEVSGGSYLTPVIPTGAVARVREGASMEMISSTALTSAAKGITPSTSSIAPPRPLIVGTGGSFQSKCLTEKDENCAAQRASCIACGGCRSKIRLSKLIEAGPEAVEVMRTEHCTCADRVSIRREVLKNYDAFVAASKAKEDIIKSQSQAIDPEEIAKAVAARRRKSSIQQPEAIGDEEMTIPASPAESEAAGEDQRQQQQPASGSKGATSIKVTGKKRPLNAISGAKQQQQQQPAAPPPPFKSDVVLKDRANVQGVYLQVTMHQLEDELWIEAIDSKTGEAFEARTKLSRAYMDIKPLQQQNEIYRQVLTHQLAFKKDITAAAEENARPAIGTASASDLLSGQRSMGAKDGRKQRRLAIIINTPAPAGARVALKRRLQRGSPLMYEIMQIEGSAFSVKAGLEALDVIISFNHQICRCESFLVLPAVAMPLLVRLRNVDPKDRNRRRILAELQRLLADANANGGTQRLASDESLSGGAIRRLVQHAVTFKRVEADLCFTLEPSLKSETGDLFSQLALLQLSATMIQSFYRGYRTRCQVKAYRVKVNQAAIQIQRMFRGYLARLQYNQLCRRMGRKNRLRRSSVKGQELVIKMQCVVRMWLAGRMARLRLLADKVQQGASSSAADANLSKADQQASSSSSAADATLSKANRKAKELQRLRGKAEQKGKEKAAIAIQSVARRYLAKQELKRRKEALRLAKVNQEEEEVKQQEAVIETLAARRRAAQDMVVRVVVTCAIRAHLARKVVADRQRAQEMMREEEEAATMALEQHRQYSALIIQCCIRSYLARQQVKRRRQGRLKQQQLEERLKAAAIIIQCSIRSYLAKRAVGARRQAKLNQEAEETKQRGRQAAALIIQCAGRSYLARQEIGRKRQARLRQEEAEKRKAAAIVLQCAVRSYLARREVGRRTQAKIKKEQQRQEQEAKGKEEKQRRGPAAMVIQCSIRSHLARREVDRRKQAKIKEEQQLQEEEAKGKEEKKRRETAAVIIQCTARSYLARQKVNRRHADKAKAEKEATASAALTIQYAIRSHLSRLKIDQKRRQQPSLLVLQCAIRCHLAKKEVAHRLSERDEANAKEAQSSLQQNIAAMVIQRLICGFLTRRSRRRVREETRLQMIKVARVVVRIQRAYRRHQAHSHVQQWEAWWAYQSQCVTLIQKMWRGHFVRRVLLPLRKYEKEQEDLQQQWSRWNVEQAAAVKIQAMARGHLARAQVKKMRFQAAAARRRSSAIVPPAPEAFQLVELGLVDEVTEALDSGALHPTMRDAFGKTLMMAAAEKGNTHMMELFLFYGADPNAQDYEEGDTALHFAKKADMDDAVEWLVTIAQADDQIKNYEGHTCYFYGL